MSSSGEGAEVGCAWSTVEDVLLCESWVKVCHCPVTGNEMKSQQMWRRILAEFSSRLSTRRTEQSFASRWKLLNKELGKWRNALAKVRGIIRSGENLSDELIQTQMWFINDGPGKKPFQFFECWEVVKHCPKFHIVPIGPGVVMNDTPLSDSPVTDSPLPSPTPVGSPMETEERPLGRKAAKKAKSNTATADVAKFLSELTKQGAIRIEQEKQFIEQQAARHQAIADNAQEVKDRETMTMNTSHMSPDTKAFWKQQRREVIRRRSLFHDDGPSTNLSDDGPSNTDWLDDSQM